MSKNCIPQDKRNAMGKLSGNFKHGGLVPSGRKTGIPDTPLEKAKRDNGIKGLKSGGKVGR